MPHFPYIADNLKQAFFQFDLKKKRNFKHFFGQQYFQYIFSNWIVLGTQMQKFIQKLIKHLQKQSSWGVLWKRCS